MPISSEQWRASVGSNNAGRSVVLGRCCGKMAPPQSLLGQFLLFVVSLFPPGAGLAAKKLSLNVAALAPIPPNTPDLKESCGPAPKGSWRGCWRLLCLMFSIAVASSLLCRSGDVETNPGPPQFDLVSANLPQLRDLLRDTQTQWFNLGLELGVNLTTLKTIETDYQMVDRRFLEMLSAWLHMVPQQSWERLVTALKKVGHADLAESIKDDFGITVVSVVPDEANLPAVTTSSNETVATTLSTERIDTEDLESQFSDIAHSTSQIIKEKNIAVSDFKERLFNLPVKNKKQHQDFLMEQLLPQITNATFHDVWLKLQLYWDFLNYTLLEHLVKLFGDEPLKSKMIEYKKELKEFRSKTRLCDFARHFNEVDDCSSGMKLLEVKFSKNWEQCTLEDLENWKEGITQKMFLPSFAMILLKIDTGCVTVTWAIPAMFAASIVTDLEAMDAKAFYEEMCIISLRVTHVKLASADLPVVQAALKDATQKWYSLGVVLGMKQETLKANYLDDELCFTEMLSAWLLSAPHPSWEDLLAALEHVGYDELAEDIRLNLGRPWQQQSSLGQDIIKLENVFDALENRTLKELKGKRVFTSAIREFLASLFLEEELAHQKIFDEELSGVLSLEDTWVRLCIYWNYFNPSLLGHLVTKFGDGTLRTDMEEYKKTLKLFESRTRVLEFANSYRQKTQHKHWTKLSLELNMNWNDHMLEDLETLADKPRQQHNIPLFLMILHDLTSTDYICATWAIPAVIGASLKENMGNTDMREFCKKEGIISITIDGEEYKYSAAKKYSAYLKDIYSHKEGKNLAPFKLARIIDLRRYFYHFTRSTLRGDQDDVVYTKEHMDEDKVGLPPRWTDNKQPRLVLIEGAPGVGKTTFSEQFCYKWSQGHLLSNHRLLVLLPLRDNRVRSARSVSDLFQHPQLQQAIAEEVESSGGEGVALWLEAWDELGEEMRNKSSIFLDLVHGRVLPKATVIITSRPWATKKLRENTSIKLDQHVEIVSTPNLQFSRILREDKIEIDSRAKFIDYVNSNLGIKAAMHTPVTADIVAEVFQWSRDTESTPPTTMTQLYTAFTCKLLMQHLSSHKEEGSKSGKIRSLDEVPADVKGRLLEMCTLAWEGILEQQLTFSSNTVSGDTLGLMHGVRELYGGEGSQLSYHFIHLTLQEFLSAYHITQLPLDRQEQVIREHVQKGHLNQVVKFYFGLTKPNTFTSRIIAQHLGGDWPDRTMEATVFHWLFETGNVDTISGELGLMRPVVASPSHSWSPLDYYVLGHSIAHYQFKWRLDCGYASMGDEEMEMLCRGMTSSTDTTWGGEIELIYEKHFKHDINISLEGIKWFVHIPLQLAQQIKTLNFNNNKLNGTALNTFSKSVLELSKLQELSLRGNPIGQGGAVQVLKCLHHCKTPLKKLDLVHTGVGEEDCAQLGPLIANTDTLETLSIPGETLSSKNVVEGLLQNSTIKHLHMGWSPLSEENCVSLASVLQRAECQWRRLDIRDCRISGEGAAHLAAALTNNHSLTELDIGVNRIGDIGAAAFGDTLRLNTSLTTLHMDRCEITSVGCVQLAAGLAENTAVQTLIMRMHDNHVGVEGAKALSEVIRGNKTLRELWLFSDDSLRKEEVDSLLASLQENTTLQKLRLPKQYRRPADPRVKWNDSRY